MDTFAFLRHVLAQQGLSEDEANCYLALLKSNVMSALDISRSSQVPRTSTYRALDSLIARGLITENTRNKKTVYMAEHPRSLVREMRAKEHSLAEAMPLLEQLIFQHPAQPSTKVYTGRRGFAAAFDSFYDHVQRTRTKQIHSLSHPDLIKKYPRIFAESVERREKLKVQIYLMMPNKVAHSTSPLLTKNTLREVRYIPQAFAQNTSMLIGGSEVLHISLSEKNSCAILIHSEAIASLLREFFKLVWDKVATEHLGRASRG